MPGYSSALQGPAKVRKQLSALDGTPQTSLTSCNSQAPGLVNCGRAPSFAGVTAWLTWNAYSNQYWPADYLIDANGYVRHVHFGEGDYSGTGQLIREPLEQARPGHSLPAPVSRPDMTPAGELSPETYVGYERLQYLLSSRRAARNTPAVYHFPGSTCSTTGVRPATGRSFCIPCRECRPTASPSADRAPG